MFGKTFITSALLATSAFAAVLPRDLPTLTNAMSDVGLGVDKLTNDVRSWDGQATTAVAILDDSKALLKTIQSSTSAIQGMTAVGLIESISVLGPTNTLTSKVDDVVNALILKKPQIDAAGITGVVAQELVDQGASAKQLADAIVAKLPSLAQAIGGPMAQQITQKLDRAIQAFNSGAAPAAAPAAGGMAGMSM